MQGQAEVVEYLKDLLRGELAARDQYFLHSRMYQDWGFNKLFERINHEMEEETQHADALLQRILFLEGVPEIARYDVIRVGTNVKEQFEYDLALEMNGVKTYNELVNLCIQLKDNGTRELVEPILTESEEHVDWLEAQVHQIKEMGYERYLTLHVEGPKD